MFSVKTQMRRAIHLVRRKNGKVVRITIGVLIILLLTITILHKSSDYYDLTLNPSNLTSSTSYAGDSTPYSEPAYPDHKPFDAKTLREAMGSVMNRIRELSPQGELDRSKGDDCRLGDLNVGVPQNDEKVSKSELLKCIQIPPDAEDELKNLHKSFLSVLEKKIMPKFPISMYHGDGIVFVGGGRFTMFVMLAIQAIRANAGRDIPIEIMIPPGNNHESGFCENILPLVDPSGLTRCVFMETLFDSKTMKNVKGYQLKALAILASSFRKTLLLDADNYVVNSIDSFFDSEIIEDYGMALWPDYWKRLHHPAVYDIVGSHVDSSRRARFIMDTVSPSQLYQSDDISKVPFHDLDGTIPDGGTESGQLLVDKYKHLDTIILSLYYNYNGPSYYYPLLGQGLAGEGDKDTFALAARALSAHGLQRYYYQLRAPVDALGYWAHPKDNVPIFDDEHVPEDQRSFRGVAMLQHDLDLDFKAYKKAYTEIKSKLVQDLKTFRKKATLSDASADLANVDELFWKERRTDGYDVNEFLSYFSDVPVTFIHSHFPKYNPWEFAQDQKFTFDGKKVMSDHKDDPNFKPTHHGHFRMYDNTFQKLSNYDLELANWLSFKEHICREDGHKNFSYLVDEIEKTEHGLQRYEEMCKYIDERVKMLKSTTWEGSRVN